MSCKSISQRALFFIIFRCVAVLMMVGGVIGLGHKNDALVAAGLASVGLFIVWEMLSQYSLSEIIVLLFGMVLTSFFGVQAEVWGVQHGYWVYHDLLDGRQFPYWLSIAWGLAFVFLYRVEFRLIKLFRLVEFKQKMLLVGLVSTILPTVGEAVAISLGSWSYSWGCQILGVPLVAIFLLMTLHLSVYLSLALVCRIFAVENAVFSSCPTQTCCGAARMVVEQD